MTMKQLTPRTKRHPLSPPQIMVLRKLAEVGACATGSGTWGTYVSGTAAAALHRRGFVKVKPQTWAGVETGAIEYEITAAGRIALEHANERKRARS